MEEIKALIAAGLAELGLSPAPAEVLAQYEELLLEKNQVMNLTAITDPVKAAQLHILDSAALLAHQDFRGAKVLDVGTGAGFPGLVLRLAEPSLRLTLLDSLGKRVNWLRAVSAQLGAADVECIHGRAEEYGVKAEYREEYDLVTSRAVAELRVLCELCLPFVKVGGRFLAMKSTDCQEELDSAGHAIRLLGGTVLPSLDYTIPGTEVTHRLVVVEKVRETPKGFPRRFARIQKAPL